MEREYFEKFIASQFENVHNKLDTQIQLQKIANGRTSKLEADMVELKQWKASSHGHWKAINKVIGFMLIILTITVGAIATYLWH